MKSPKRSVANDWLRAATYLVLMQRKILSERRINGYQRLRRSTAALWIVGWSELLCYYTGGIPLE
jgi:hypothetical protein